MKGFPEEKSEPPEPDKEFNQDGQAAENLDYRNEGDTSGNCRTNGDERSRLYPPAIRLNERETTDQKPLNSQQETQGHIHSTHCCKVGI